MFIIFVTLLLVKKYIVALLQPAVSVQQQVGIDSVGFLSAIQLENNLFIKYRNC